MKYLSLFLMFYSIQSHAFDQEFSIYAGASLSNKASYVLQGTTSISADVDGKTSPIWGMDFQKKVSDQFSLGVILDYSYMSADNLAGTDTTYSLMFAPKYFSYKNENLKLWGCLGLGLAYTTYATTYTDSTGSLSSTDSALALAVSPRVGADYTINETTFIGLQASYMMLTSSTISGRVVAGSVNAPTPIEVSRKSFSAMLRVGWLFGESEKKSEDQIQSK